MRYNFYSKKEASTNSYTINNGKMNITGFSSRISGVTFKGYADRVLGCDPWPPH